VVFSTQAGPCRRTVPLAARNSYPSDVRLLERERPLDVHDDRACRAVARARSMMLVAGEVGKTVLLRVLVEPGVGEDVAAVGDVRHAPPVGAVTGCRGRAGRAGDRPAAWLGGPATLVGQFSRRRPGWDEEPP
jgi:hypothetical protein